MTMIGNRPVGNGARPYLIAEMSGNHNQSLDRALEIVDAAAHAGADAIKLQTYTAETMTLDVRKPGFLIEDHASIWHGQQLYELYEEAHTPWDWHQPIFDRAASHGIHCFSTPFDDTAVDFLMTLNVPAFKVASFECTDLPLIHKIALTGKPMIISTGMATVAEIDDATRTAREGGCSDIVLLKCTSTYPSSPENSNIRTIPHLQQMFGTLVDLSDHTMGCGSAVAAVALGASVVEKHFTLSRADGGVDSTFSLEPHEFRQLRTEADNAWQALGSIQYGTTPAERNSTAFRRSLYISADVKSGEILTERNMRIVRPGFGLPPKYYDIVLGRRVNCDLTVGSPISWDIFI